MEKTLLTLKPVNESLTHNSVVFLARNIDESSGASLATRKLEVNVLRSLLRFCAESGHLSADYGFLLRHMAKGSLPKQVSAPALSEAQVVDILRFTQQECSKFDDVVSLSIPARMNHRKYPQAHDAFLTKTVFALLFSMGMRASEVCAIRLRDIKRQGRISMVRLRVKGGGEDLRQIPNGVSLLIEDWIDEWRKPLNPPADAPVFASSPLGNEPLSRFTLRRKLQKGASLAGVNVDGFTAHSARATVAGLLHSQGETLVAIADLLGHRSIESTARYSRSVQNSTSLGDKLPYANKIILSD